MMSTFFAVFVGLLVKIPKKVRGRGRAIVWAGARCKGLPVKTYYGVELACNIDDFTNRAAILGMYGEIVYREVVAQNCGGAFIDIGANCGLFSIVASRAVGRQGVVFCFEPQPSVFRDLEKNVTLNQCRNVTAWNRAVSTYSGTLRLTDISDGHTGVARIDPSSNRDGYDVRSVNLDSELDEIFDACEGRPITIKIDVEGAECLVIRGMTRFIKRAHKVIVEVDNRNLKKFGDDTICLYDLMEGYGFRPKVGKSEKHYDEVFEKVA